MQLSCLEANPRIDSLQCEGEWRDPDEMAKKNAIKSVILINVKSLLSISREKFLLKLLIRKIYNKRTQYG